MPCTGGSSFLVEGIRQDVLRDHRPPSGRGAPAAHARGAPSETWESVGVSVPGVPGSAMTVHTLAWRAKRVRAPPTSSRKPPREETGNVVCCCVVPREPKEMPLPAVTRRPRSCSAPSAKPSHRLVVIHTPPGGAIQESARLRSVQGKGRSRVTLETGMYAL